MSLVHFIYGCWYISVTFFCLFLSHRRGVTSSSPEQLQGSLSLWSLLSKQCTEDLIHFNLIRLHSARSSLLLPVAEGVGRFASPHLDREMRACACPRMHDSVWVFLVCTSSLIFREALFHLTHYEICLDNSQASWVGKRFRSNGSQTKGTSRWVILTEVMFILLNILLGALAECLVRFVIIFMFLATD